MEKIIRKLARSTKWQNLYHECKEIGSLSLFNNRGDLTKIQEIFLTWLTIYASLYYDLASGEKYISKEVIKDDLRTDSYLLYKKKFKNKKGTSKDKSPIDTTSGIPSMRFKRKV